MTVRLNEKLRVARVVLGKLEGGPLRWTPLMKSVLEGEATPWEAQVILEWLLKEGYIERPERGKYYITNKGTGFLRLEKKIVS